MQVECTGRQVTISAGLRSLVEEGMERIRRVLGRSAVGAHVVLTKEKHRGIAEVTVKTRARTLVALCESAASIETALRDALAKAEAQALRYRNKVRSQKRQPKEAKQLETPTIRVRGSGRSVKGVSAKAPKDGASPAPAGRAVTVHSFPARIPISEPHITRSTDSVALRPMTLEEAVKEAEFRDHDVFVFRDDKGNVMILHRKRDGKMELIEAP